MDFHETRVHNARKPVGEVRTVAQGQPGEFRAKGRKPTGLWWAFGNEWHDFVAENAGKRGVPKSRKPGKHDYEVLLAPEAAIAVLDSWEAILDFTRRYGCPAPHAVRAPDPNDPWDPFGAGNYDPERDPRLHPANPDMPAFCSVSYIDWGAVAQDYDVIEVLNYREVMNSRPRVEWLDVDWEMSSGCVWAAEAAKLRKLDFEAMPTPGGP